MHEGCIFKTQAVDFSVNISLFHESAYSTGSQSEKEAQNERLQAFYDRCSECVSKIRTDFDNGKQLYKDCHEFYGEKVNPGLRVFFG